MNLLISTENNDHFSVAIGDTMILNSETVQETHKQSELLLKTITELLKKNKVKLEELKNIFVVNGPGGFSATRIGVATANAIGYAQKIPVVGIEIKKEWSTFVEKEKLARVWLEAVALINKEDFSGQIVLPVYDREPNITMKK